MLISPRKGNIFDDFYLKITLFICKATRKRKVTKTSSNLDPRPWCESHGSILGFTSKTASLQCKISLKTGMQSTLSLDPRPSHHGRGPNGPFPSCCLSRFRSESWCSTIVREMSLICIRIRNSFPFEWLCTRTRFETEPSSNSEMVYYCASLRGLHGAEKTEILGNNADICLLWLGRFILGTKRIWVLGAL